MKKVFFAIVLLLLLVTETYADVLINDANFPDTNFRTYISDNIDKNNDGNLTDTEIEATTSISVMGIRISSLKGIEYFTSLTSLNCSGNQITELDLSKCSALEVLNCSTNRLSLLNLSDCDKLKDVVGLICHNQDSSELKIIGLNVVEQTENTSYPYKFNYKYISAAEYSGILEDESNAIKGYDKNSNELLMASLSGELCFASKPYEIRYTYKNRNSNWTPTTAVSIFIDPQDTGNTPDTPSTLTKPVITTQSIPNGYLGVVYSELQLTATGNSITWSAVDLPKGLSCSEGGVISGTPEEAGYFYVTITATNELGNTSEILTFLISTSMPDPNKISLSATVLEHGRGDGLYSRDGGRGILYNAVSNDNAYLDYQGEIITEAKIASITDKVYIKKGFTADGNTRLILRIQSSKPGSVSFDVPMELGARLESLEGRKELSSASILATTQVSNYINPYASNNQATAVLIAPKDYPSGMRFPSDSFDVKVRFSDGSNTAEMSIPLEIHATPVVLIHGLWGSGLANFGLQNEKNGKNGTGIHTKLRDAGFSVTYWDYDGTLGPSDVIKGKGNPLYSHISSVQKKMNLKGIACTRVDFVCHSMGGLMARQYTRSDLDTGNRSMHSYMSDSVRRIVTVATPHDGSPIANYLLEDFDELGLDRVDPFFADIFKFARGAVKELVGKINGYATAAFTDLAVNSTLLNELGYPKSVPMYVIYGTIKNHLEPLKETINGFADVANNVADAVVVYELVSGNYIWSHKSRLLLTGAVLIKCLAPNVSDIVESILNDIIFDGDDYDIAVPKSSALAHDKFLANSQLYDGWDDQHCYNHMEICVQDDVGDYVVELLKGPEDKFKIFGKNGKSSSIANKKSVVKVSDTSNTAEAVLKERFKMSVAPSVISVSETETGETKLKATTQGEVVESVYVLLNGERIFSLGSSDGGNTFETKLVFGSRDVGIYDVLCLSPSSESSKDILISNIAQIIVKPMLSNVASIGFPNELDSIATNVGAKINLGLCATTTDGRIYDISSPLMGTEWTSDDIAFVTDRGEVKGLKEGVTILKATYQGLTASISVDVGASYFDDNTTTPQDDDKEAQEQLNNEFNNTLNSSGAGCNGICYGVLACSLIFLFFNNKRENFG